jgi:FkbM family methyltransferase
MIMLPDVEWGSKKIALRFDKHPYAVAEAVPNAVLIEQLQGYEPEILNVFERFVEPGDCVVDAGACIGFHTCFLSKLVGEDGLVFAFEPQLESFQYLAHHVHVSNRLNNVALFKFALWKCDVPELELFSVKDIGYSSLHRYMESIGSEKVEGRALDTLLLHDHPRVIKIDCEGTEAEVLCGAHNMLARGVDCVVLELNFHLMNSTGQTDRVIREYMAALGYDMFLINLGDGAGGYLPPSKVEPHLNIKLDGGHHINVMFSTQQKVDERWKTNAI